MMVQLFHPSRHPSMSILTIPTAALATLPFLFKIGVSAIYEGSGNMTLILFVCNVDFRAPKRFSALELRAQ